MSYKETLQMPQTDFPMRGNLPKKEPEMQAHWEETNMYQKVQARTNGRPKFILHDGPPYANGSLHMGHALNKTLKDIIVRSKSMTGYDAPYVPGWDTHGLPIEQELTKKGVKRKEMSVAEFRKLCEQYAFEQIDNQRTAFKKLGVRGEWENPYLTLRPLYEAQQIRVFGEMSKKGLIYKGLKPVYWSPSSESALAEAEIEYKDVRSPSIYVAFKVRDGKGVLDNDTEIIIWTTTPWTIPANLGISVHPELEYVVAKVNDRKFVVAKALVNDVAETLEWENYEVVKTVKGTDLEYVVAKHPFYDRDSLVMVGEHVTTDAGTGCVHTAPGHGEDDFYVSQKYDLGVLSPVDNRGHMTDEAPGFEGLYYDKANKFITEKLEEVGALLKLSFFTHSYPHDWRTKKPVIFRATPQWFASIDPIREQLLQEINNVKWHNQWGETRLYNMIRDRGDWCISRQRVWGVPIPVFYGENGETIVTEETIEHVAKLFEEHGSNVWFEKEAKDLLPKGFAHPSSPNGVFTKENDIMDVWFDSGSSHHGVLKTRDELQFPADIYLEGSDQYRGWFNSSLIISVAVNGVAPYKGVISNGFTVDAEGKKMSKSVGNVIVPEQVTKQFGADILRLWVSSVDYTTDVRVFMDNFKQVSEVYRKIRNTLRFMLGNLADFNPDTDKVVYEDLGEVDKYMLVKLNDLIKDVRENYDKFDFAEIYHDMNNFFNLDLSAFYLDFAKDILYIEAPNDLTRRSMQTVIYEAVVSLTKLLAPILVHTADEVWNYIPGVQEESVQLTDMPVAVELEDAAQLKEKWDYFMDVRDDVLKALEEARNEKVIGKSLESKITIVPKDEKTKSVLENIAHLHQYLIVSEVVLADENSDAKEYNYVNVLVEKHPAEKCQRCWVSSDTVGQNEEYPDLCDRCAHVVSNFY